MKVVKAILAIPLTLLNTIWLVICFLFTFLLCFFVLIKWCAHYRKLRNNGHGDFHTLFFRGPFSLYQVLKNYELIWTF